MMLKANTDFLNHCIVDCVYIDFRNKEHTLVWFFPSSHIYKCNCWLVISRCAAVFGGVPRSCSAPAQTQWRGCAFTVFFWAVDHVCAHYTVSWCWCRHCNRVEAGEGPVTCCANSTCVRKCTGRLKLRHVCIDLCCTYLMVKLRGDASKQRD